MTRYLLDTNAVSDVMRDHPQVRARVAKHPGLLISSNEAVARLHKEPGMIVWQLSQLPRKGQ